MKRIELGKAEVDGYYQIYCAKERYTAIINVLSITNSTVSSLTYNEVSKTRTYINSDGTIYSEDELEEQICSERNDYLYELTDDEVLQYVVAVVV